MRIALKMRLDQFLVDRGYFATRSRARDAILRGAVTIDGNERAEALATGRRRGATFRSTMPRLAMSRAPL